MRLLRPKTVRQVTLYGKPGCHLCEDTRQILQRLEGRFPMTLVEVDIRTDRDLFRKYDIRIPVVRVDGGHVLEAPISERDLRRALSHRP